MSLTTFSGSTRKRSPRKRCWAFS